MGDIVLALYDSCNRVRVYLESVRWNIDGNICYLKEGIVG